MTTAFVLSGGANLGAVQVGMLAALAEAGVRPDVIVGTSVGAVNGAWLAAGAEPSAVASLGELWRSLRRADVFPTDLRLGLLGFVGRRDHLVSNRGLRALLARHLRFDRIEDAPIPLHLVATDVLTGTGVVMSSGSAIDAVLASAAIPGVLPPVLVGGRPLMDGGTLNNTPISHAVDLGATEIWVLTTGVACALERPPTSALGMALHGISLAVNQRVAVDVERFHDRCELRVVPPLCPVRTSPTDFSQAGVLMDRARASTKEWLASPSSFDVTDVLAPHAH